MDGEIIGVWPASKCGTGLDTLMPWERQALEERWGAYPNPPDRDTSNIAAQKLDLLRKALSLGGAHLIVKALEAGLRRALATIGFDCEITFCNISRPDELHRAFIGGKHVFQIRESHADDSWLDWPKNGNASVQIYS